MLQSGRSSDSWTDRDGVPGAPNSFLLLVAMPGAPSSFLLLVVLVLSHPEDALGVLGFIFCA